MRVLQINSVCGLGSTGRIATDIHAILKEQGHDSYIAYGRDNPMNCDTAIRIGNKLDNYAHVVKTRILDMHGFGSKKATKEFIDRVTEIDPDVIHLHNIHGYYINIEMLFEYLKKADKPVIWTLHDCWAFTGHCSYFDLVGCECWKLGGDHKCIQPKSYPTSWLINNSKRNFCRKKSAFLGVENLTIVTPSRWLAGLVKESFLKEYPIKVINNGIDLEVFKPIKSDFRKANNIQNKFVILGVASLWDRRKGFGYFIKLSEKLEEDETIVLVGLSQKQKENLPKNIIGITRTNNADELVEIYSTSDVFVNPTLEDNFPTTNIEALASGTPVITFDTGGSIESIDSSCGFIVSRHDIEGIIKGIRKIKFEDKLNYSINSVNRANKLYDKNEKFKEYIKLYSSTKS